MNFFLLKKYLSTLLCFTACAQISSLSAATYTVDSSGDGNSGSGMSGTLRYCINQTNAAGGSNTILFNTGITSVTLGAPLSPIGPNITSIDLGTNSVTIQGGGSYSGLFIGPSV
jgi:hypothetical protein